MTLIRFNAATGAKLVHVPYKSGGSLLPDLIAGNIQGAMTEFSTALPHHKSGKARLIAIASVRRTSLASEVATMIEGGIAGFTGGSYVGILAPAGTPTEVIARLQSALAKALASDKLQERLRELGAEIATAEQMTAAGFAAFIRAEFESMRQAAQAAELKKE
jgi:tripartite-type tricarboxylate transporter receptor subunit TctC